MNTDLIQNSACYELAGAPGATWAEAEPAFKAGTGLPIATLEPVDISNAVLWLASDESRYVAGTTQVVDAGVVLPFKIPHS